MATTPDIPVTQAIRVLRAAKAAFKPHLYAYVEKGGTAASSEALGFPEHQVIKTLIFADDQKRALVVLMHGDRQVSAKSLARCLGAKSVQPCEPKTAEKHSGYQVGGTSPFGLKTKLPIYAEASIFALPILLINGGKRGFLIEIAPAVLEQILQPIKVDIAQAP